MPANNLLSRNKIQELHTLLLTWYRRNGRSFIWRNSHDPYVILVSEIMLQQTQTARVSEKLPVFLKQFPNIAALSRAKRSTVINAWRGMGYNRRAVYLHECAKKVTHSGKAFPNTTDEIMHLPGVGKYTASAIMCFAQRKRVPVVDVNIRRVLSRIVKRQRTLHSTIDEKSIWNIAETLLPQKKYYEWNQALMDIGAIICMQRKTLCNVCPLQGVCASSEMLIRTSSSTMESVKKKIEPSHNGVPNRIWRGRIIELLRNKKSITIQRSGKAIDSAFTTKEKKWLEKLLRRLQHDGLIKINNNVITLAE